MEKKVKVSELYNEVLDQTLAKIKKNLLETIEEYLEVNHTEYIDKNIEISTKKIMEQILLQSIVEGLYDFFGIVVPKEIKDKIKEKFDEALISRRMEGN